LLTFWREFASNLSGEVVLDSFTQSPADIEQALPNMARGDLLVGSFANDQVGYHRPFPGAGQYRTPIPGLYLCGGSTHPGGNVTGLCGYNAARVIAADCQARIWWNPPNIEEVLSAQA
jgi:phytoene dehydrogenase-like protein